VSFLPPFFPAINVASVWAVFGANAVRVLPFGEMPQGATKPYAVWQTVFGSPENYLGDVPRMDAWGIQVDVYAKTIEACIQGATVLRDALEPVSHITSWRATLKEPATELYRMGFDVEFLSSRS
jgi:hypothetical protein